MNDIVERIRKILAKTEEAGCTQAESEAAMAMASRLMAEHNLSMSEVTKGGEAGRREGLSVLWQVQQCRDGTLGFPGLARCLRSAVGRSSSSDQGSGFRPTGLRGGSRQGLYGQDGRGASDGPGRARRAPRDWRDGSGPV
jgi:hypothetical protein